MGKRIKKMAAKQNVYHGGKREGAGRKATGIKREAHSISVRSEQWEALQQKAYSQNMTVSELVVKSCIGGIMENTFFVADDSGNIAAHDCSKATAEQVLEDLKEKEPEAGWEMFDASDKDE